jgi:hypothetical protein
MSSFIPRRDFMRLSLAISGQLVLLNLTASAFAHEGHDHGSAFAQAGGKAGNNRVEITVRGDYRIISSNGMPNHQTGQFPNRGNPNRIGPQRYVYRMALHPKKANAITPVGFFPCAVALNGLPFDPSANEFWQRDRNSGWQYEALAPAVQLGMDQNHAHVQPNGAYHYHGFPAALYEKLNGNKKDEAMVLMGYAADGFPLYGPFAYTDPQDAKSPIKQMKSSYQLKMGKRPDGPGGKYDGTFVQDYEHVPRSGDLDACNGREGVTPEYPEGTYYYVITSEFPFIPRKLQGTPDATFLRHGHPAGGPPGGPGGGPPGGPGGPGGGPGSGNGGPRGGGM